MKRSIIIGLVAVCVNSVAIAAPGPRRFQNAVETLRDANRWQARLEAAVALGAFEDSRAYRHLVSALDDPHFAVRAAGMRALVRLQDPRALPHLLQGLTDSEPFVRSEARKAVARFDFEDARPYLVRALKRHPDARVRLTACERLAEQPDAATVEVLLDATGDPPPVGRYAAGVLAALPLAVATRAFIAGLDHQDYVVQVASIQALSDLGAAEAVPKLIAKLDARVPDVMLAATEALRNLRDDIDGKKYRVSALRAKARLQRVRAIKVLGVLGEEEDRRLLIGALDDSDVMIRGAAVTALGNLQETRALPKLTQMRASSDNARIISSLKATLRRLRDLEEPAESEPTARAPRPSPN